MREFRTRKERFLWGGLEDQGNRERPAGVSVSRGTKEKVRSGPWNRANSCPPTDHHSRSSLLEWSALTGPNAED